MQEKVEQLKTLLGIASDDTDKDLLVQFAFESAQELILNYCKSSLGNTMHKG